MFIKKRLVMGKEPQLDGRHKKILEFVGPEKDSKILVIGTGVFPRTEYFLTKKYECKNITTGDIDKWNLASGRKILPNAQFLELDAQKRFPFKDDSFDRVVFTEVLEHLEDENIALNEIKRVLKRGGWLILTVPKKRWFNIFSPITWVQHKREYNERQITRLVEKYGFKINKMFVGGDIYDLLGLWIHLILKHFFGRVYVDCFFMSKVNKAYSKGFRGKGTDIIMQAEK